jgi:UPF0716 protein FxsA
MLIPGLVSSALGALMLLPPTRSAVRPVATAMLTRGVTRRMGAMNPGSVFPGSMFPGDAREGYIDGEVVDGEVVGWVVDDQAPTPPRGAIARRNDT